MELGLTLQNLGNPVNKQAVEFQKKPSDIRGCQAMGWCQVARHC